MTQLVTGATGFIGKHLVQRLLADGDRVRALARRPDAVPAGAEACRGDLTDAASLEAAVAGVRCVYHLAATVSDWGPDDLFQSTNVRGTEALLSAAARAGCQRFVYVSSVAVYGEALLGPQPCTEDLPLDAPAQGSYPQSKRDAEALLRAHPAAATVGITIVRPGNVYGPGSPLWVDEVIRVLRAGGVPLIDGGRGRATLAYVDNVVDLLVRAARSTTAAGRTYNANDGGDVTWGQYIRDLAVAAGLEPPRLSLPGAVVSTLAAAMESGARLVGKKTRPPLTRQAVRLLRCRAPVPIARAHDELGFVPPVPYADGIARVKASLRAA